MKLRDGVHKEQKDGESSLSPLQSSFHPHTNSTGGTAGTCILNPDTAHSISPLCVYSTVQYSTVQYSTVQYSTVLYYTILYYTILYYTILYSYSAFCSRIRPQCLISQASQWSTRLTKLSVRVGQPCHSCQPEQWRSYKGEFFHPYLRVADV